ncbi:MAG TPA: regulatory protein RecX [Pyrinomonadaceae bacterium]|nr:regulatory protein RecX [Pyrinomonadaceae bacterium]
MDDIERVRERTMNRAVRLLAAKPRSVEELRGLLLEKPWADESAVDAAIERLREYKYLDDEQYARDVAVSNLWRKPQGRRSLQQMMSRKKLGSETVRDAIDDAYAQLPEVDLINAAIEKRLRMKGRPETREDTKKFYDHLLRRGFSYDLIREKMALVAKGRLQNDGEDQL